MAQRLELPKQADPDITTETVALSSPLAHECPDCQSLLTEFYDWDQVRYRCENCGVQVSESTAILQETLIDETVCDSDPSTPNDNNMHT